MKTLPFCLGLVRASEQQLAKSFAAIAKKHSSDYDIHEGCKHFSQWCEAHLEKLAEFGGHHGMSPNRDPARLRRALFHGPRIGGFGLVRDLQDLLLLVHQTRTGWTALLQAAKAIKDTEMVDAAENCAGEIDRQMDWLCTHIKVAAPQALTVPVNMKDELKESAPALALKVLIGATIAAGMVVAIKELRAAKAI